MPTWPRQTLRSRVAGRLVTGPLGHLFAGAIDWLVLAARLLYGRARGRSPDAER